ncbi:MAG: TIR domain-containing protein [Caulobacteraceae bacterium]
MKVFVVHARADAAFADQLAAFLQDAGFRPVVDRTEGRQAGGLIANADAVVSVLTPASASAEACSWELSEAQRLGKRVLLVLPDPMTGLPEELADLDPIYFYSDPAVPNSGFFDGQRRLEAALRGNRERVLPPFEPPSREVIEQERREARAARERERRDERERRKAEQRELAQRIALARATQEPRMRRRFPVLRVTFLGLVAAAVIGVVINPHLPDDIRGAWTNAAAALMPEEEPYSPMSVPAEDYAPDRALIAARGGANVRNYPLTSGTLLLEAPPGTRFRVNGRLEVQGKWWFRVVLDDGRVGFVREDVVFWERPGATQQTANVANIEPAVEVTAGRAGAKVRARPSRSASVIVRLPASATMSATGKVRQGGHWWLRVALQDGRNGFVRDDVLTAGSREALDL